MVEKNHSICSKGLVSSSGYKPVSLMGVFKYLEISIFIIQFRLVRVWVCQISTNIEQFQNSPLNRLINKSQGDSV